ncbi:MAG: DUF4395 domain-containing protein [Gammaproteobacteria bacterium]|nr:DUF4395 domain-containing protein [Gammaproteobacteria bacterium]MDH5652002.1 DUF4395 domain-containing protein [Gammaproteobacteria bacterium]
MSKALQFGETVEGYDIPVLNEREIRAAAGLLFLLLFTSVLIVATTENFLLLKYAVTIFFVDILIRLFISPRFAPTLILGRLIVRNQNPEYVGAPQKKFAWAFGAILSAIFFTLMVVVNSFSPITGIICFTCLIFLFFETAFGICLGCKFYSMYYKQQARYCPGEICLPESRQAIQKTGSGQILVLLAFIAFIALTAMLFNDYFSVKPYDMFGINTPKQ